MAWSRCSRRSYICVASVRPRSYGKVAEFQKRGAVHCHAVVRLDGPDGPDSPPPAWATVPLEVVPAAGLSPERELRWGTQVDVQPIGALGHEDLTEQAVAAYVAKYATEAAETTGTVDRRVVELGNWTALACLPTRGGSSKSAGPWTETPDRLLARWSHILGFRGHFSTKSRRYFTTLGALRQVRADYRARQERQARGLPEDLDDSEGSTFVLAHWTYAGHAHTPGESWLAQSITNDIKQDRQLVRELRAELDDFDTTGEWWPRNDCSPLTRPPNSSAPQSGSPGGSSRNAGSSTSRSAATPASPNGPSWRTSRPTQLRRLSDSCGAWPDGSQEAVLRPCPQDWLPERRAELRAGDGTDPDASKVPFGSYAATWITERGIGASTADLYRSLLRSPRADLRPRRPGRHHPGDGPGLAGCSPGRGCRRFLGGQVVCAPAGRAHDRRGGPAHPAQSLPGQGRQRCSHS